MVLMDLARCGAQRAWDLPGEEKREYFRQRNSRREVQGGERSARATEDPQSHSKALGL